MAFAIAQNYYLVNVKKNEKMHLCSGRWDNIFPDPVRRGYSSINDADMNFFKISDVFPRHRIENKRYMDYLFMQARGLVALNRDQFTKDIEKIIEWCGTYDIICVQNLPELESVILTGTLVKGEKTGVFNHYLEQIILRRLRVLKSKWRIYKLTHWGRTKRSASRQSWLQRGTALQNEETEGEQEQ